MGTIRQKVQFKAKPQEIYEALMDSEKHSEFTEAPAKISKEVGGKFSCYDGYIIGKNIELIPGKKIVQLWHGSDFPNGHFSKVTFEMKAKDEGTELKMVHEDLPEENVKSIENGWKEHYWDKMKKVFDW